MDDRLASDLGTRFQALPAELRASIFSQLLVRPVKWDVKHLENCKWSMAKTTSDSHTRPSHHDLPLPENTYICAECGPFTHERSWRHAFNRGYQVYVSPWRSKWSLAQSNPYLCTNCYDDRWRTRPFPESKNLPCLCARRSNLEVRLVCRRWNFEASKVFFSENTFAFDDFISMSDFFSAIPECWKGLITKASVLLPQWKEDDNESVPNAELLATTLSVLENLTWLRHLELDAKLLHTELTAAALINCDIPSLGSVHFVVQCPYKQIYSRNMEPPTHIWDELGGRHLLSGRFAELVARSMKSQRIDIPSGQTMKEEVRRQRQRYQFLQEDQSLWNLACKQAARHTASDGLLDSGTDHVSRPVTVSSIFDIAD